MRDIPLNERLIFALDCSGYEEAKAWIDRLDGAVSFFL